MKHPLPVFNAHHVTKTTVKVEWIGSIEKKIHPQPRFIFGFKPDHNK